jgi:hypothetical protein
MERHSDVKAIESMLREMRPTPRAELVAELDTQAASGFARGDSRVKRVFSRLQAIPPRRILTPAAASAVAAIAIATAVVSPGDRGPASTTQVHRPSATQFSGAPARLHETAANDSSAGSNSSAGATALGYRDVERSAQVTLLADPEDVADDSAQVFAAVHDAHGVVLRSNTTQGPAGRAGATFELLIPSARLGDALAAISAIDEVGSRHDATADITAPTVAVGERLADARAKIEGLLAQLASAETEAEREALEVELRGERRQAARLQAQLDRLHKRTRYSHVTVRIETGGSSGSGGAWGVDDAFHDARHILSVAAGVTLVGLAVLAPLALLSLLAWLAHRAWLQLRRERALS